jgi:hypothetical protein
MTEHNRQFDDPEPHVSDRLRRDLQGLFQPPGPVPSRVDDAILNQARRRLARPHPRIIRLRWAAGMVAAAAVVVLGVVLFNNPQSSRPVLAEGRADVDGNGRVDILDAFRLARDIEARGPADSRWDLNGDGRVDREDVDLIAYAAVRLGPGPQARRDADNPLGHVRVASSRPKTLGMVGADSGSHPQSFAELRRAAALEAATRLDTSTSVGCVPRTAVEQEKLGKDRSPQTQIVACAGPLDKGV